MKNDLKRVVFSKQKNDLLYKDAKEGKYTPVVFDAVFDVLTKSSDVVNKLVESGYLYYLPHVDQKLYERYGWISFSDVFKQFHYEQLGIASGYSTVEVAVILESSTDKLLTVESALSCYEKAKVAFIKRMTELFKEDDLFLELKNFLKETDSEIVVVSWFLEDKFLEAKTKGWLAKFLEELRSTLK